MIEGTRGVRVRRLNELSHELLPLLIPAHSLNLFKFPCPEARSTDASNMHLLPPKSGISAVLSCLFFRSNSSARSSEINERRANIEHVNDLPLTFAQHSDSSLLLDSISGGGHYYIPPRSPLTLQTSAPDSPRSSQDSAPAVPDSPRSSQESGPPPYAVVACEYVFRLPS